MKKKESSKNNTSLVSKPDYTPATHGGRLVQCFLNVDLRNSHDGLLEIARKRGVDFQKLKLGQYLAFINEQKNRFKIFALAPNGRGAIIIYYKSYQGRIDREAIQSVPLAFGSKQMIEAGPKTVEGLDDHLRMQRVRTVKAITLK